MIPNALHITGSHIPTASGTGLCREARNLMIIRDGDSGALNGKAIIQTIRLRNESLRRARIIAIPCAVVAPAVVVLHVQPPETAIVHVALDDGEVGSPDTPVRYGAARYVGRFGRHSEAEARGHGG